MQKYLFILLLIFSCDEPVIEGCTTSTACNYSVDADKDDGSCVAPEGCNEWCEGDTTIVLELDCIGECGGTLVKDCANICDGTAVVDADENCYATVQIGEQLWMAENLKVTHYQNGDEIPTGYTGSEWHELETGAYAVYDDDLSNANIYGNLYNWFSVDDDRGVCPEGFHVPSEYEWIELEIFMGISESEANSIGWRGTDEGGRLKSTGTIEGGDGLWSMPNEGATNKSGFTALPGGCSYGGDSYGLFSYMSYYCIFWSTTVSNSNFVWTRMISYSSSQIGRDDDFIKQQGFSIRCLKD